jgi:hypothetical protein
MKTFRVFGRKYQDYQTEVTASDEYEAIEIANKLETHKWYEVKTDDLIEATDVYLDEDTYEYPNMESGIIVGGK